MVCPVPPRSTRRSTRGFAMALTLLAAACSDLPTSTVSEPAGTPSQSATTSPIDIWWPKDGEWLSGDHPIKGVLKGYTLGQYRMFWRVDNGALVSMYDSYEEGAHKRAWINVDSWSWNGSGPYRITLVAKSPNGRTLAEQSVNIFVGTRPATAIGPNPLAGARFFVDPYSNAKRQADLWRASRPADAEAMDQIARRSQADWFGDWNRDVRAEVAARVTAITQTGALPVLVAYNIPIRDCNSHSAGGAANADAYRSWIQAFAAGIGTRRAVVVLEPDGLAALDCLTPAQRLARQQMFLEAVGILKAQPGVAVYLDAGNANWQPATVMATRLQAAGIAKADGFALNVSNFHTNRDNIAFGEQLSKLIGDKHFVIDTSRNGLGGTTDYEWCNPSGRALGHPPTASTGHALVDAFLWIKRPGESDGTCNGGPSAGGWWADYALGLAQRMPQQIAMLP